MWWWKKKRISFQLFQLQQDRQYGRVLSHTPEADFDQFLSTLYMVKKSGAHPVPLSSSISRRRLRIGLGMIFAVVVLLIARSAQLQIVEGEQYSVLSLANREYVELIVPSRGVIMDRAGSPLAWSEPAFVLTMTPSQLPEGENRRTLFEHVAGLIGLQPTDIDLLLTQYAFRPDEAIPIEDDLPYEAAMRMAIEVADLPGFSLTTTTKRVYSSFVSSLSHVLGYMGPLTASDLEERRDDGYRLIDSIGKTGVEREYETLVRGIPGKLIYEVDALGNKLSIISKQDPTPGSNITLSIDAEFQKFIEQELQKILESVNASRGSVIAIDPSSGAVRALVSLPAYDANEFIEGITTEHYTALLENEDHPLFPRAIAGEFPSGSTFKPFVAYAALVEGIVSEHTSFLSTGGLRIGQWFFPDWKEGGHGITDVRKAIAESVNTYFYILGGGYDTVTGLGVERIMDYARIFGFGAPTGIDLGGEADGFLPSKEWKEQVKGERWYVGDTYHIAIGQGDFLTTPLQMAVATAVIANGGFKLTPYIVESGDGFGANLVKHMAPEEIQGLDPYAMNIVREGLRQAVTQGSARSLNDLPQAVAGKTGTAQTPGELPPHSWFTGFGPYENPSIALAILVEEGGESTDSAVPLAKSIFQWWFAFGATKN